MRGVEPSLGFDRAPLGEPIAATGAAANRNPPLAREPVILVAAVGAAEGARPAAAALACAAAGGEAAPLLIDIGGRPPRPTLVATTAAQRLEERLVAHLPAARLAARGQLCQLAVPAEDEGLALARAAATVARDAAVIVHLAASAPRDLLDRDYGPDPTAVLLRADVRAERAQLALAVRELRQRSLAVAVLKRRLSWVAERRALFGALPADQPGLPARVVGLLRAKEERVGHRMRVGGES